MLYPKSKRRVIVKRHVSPPRNILEPLEWGGLIGRIERIDEGDAAVTIKNLVSDHIVLVEPPNTQKPGKRDDAEQNEYRVFLHGPSLTQCRVIILFRNAN